MLLGLFCGRWFFALSQDVPDDPVYRDCRASLGNSVQYPVLSSFEVVVQLLGFDLCKRLSLLNGVARRLTPGDDPLGHEVAKPRHDYRSCHC